MPEGKVIEGVEKQLFRILESNILPEGCYLAGGTAVYFYLKHHVSIDLDFFSPKSFNPEIFIHNIKRNFNEVDVELMEKNTIILYLSKDKIS
jgi:hypothetical protein